MRIPIHFLLFLLLKCICFLSYDGAEKKRGRQQTVDYSKQTKQSSTQSEKEDLASETSNEEKPYAIADTEMILSSSSSLDDVDDKDIKLNKIEKSLNDSLISLASRKCNSVNDQVKYAIYAYWKHDYINAYICARDISNVKSVKVNGVIQSILHNIFNMGYLSSLSFTDMAKRMNKDLKSEYSLSRLDTKPKLSQWEVLGPIPVSKLEIDADPTFNEYHTSKYSDIIEYILAMPTESKICSEHASHGLISWKTINMNMRSGML